jgi:ElaB/YqjD/DUF883 family membrane-anchored ribosome-binding protein
MGEDTQAIRAQIAATRNQMGETADAIAYRTNVKARTRDRVNSKVDIVRSRLGLGMSRVTDATPSPDDVREGAVRAAGLAQENPLGLAIGSAAVGFLVGLAMPATQVENERLGPIADEVKDQVMHTGQEALGAVREIVQDGAAGAVAAVQESSQEHAEELKSSAEESVEHVRDAAHGATSQ